MSKIDFDAAEARLLSFLDVEGVTGEEKAIGKQIVAALKAAGVPGRAISFDKAHDRIPMPTQTGNLIVKLAGRGALKDNPGLLFMTHMDTVPLCAGAQPVRRGKKIVNAAKTALGGDNRTGCGVLVTLASELIRSKSSHPPLTLLFTVREESGLWGARFVEKSKLGAPAMAFNFDGMAANNVIVGAVGADRWHAEVFGLAAHAGGAPEKGISATLIMADALSRAAKGGWFGKIVKKRKFGTSNVGPVSGHNGGPAGDATNVVTDYVQVLGESRSHDAKFVSEITAAYKDAFSKAAAHVTNAAGKSGRVKFTKRTDYHPFLLDMDLPVVKYAISAVEAIGLDPEPRAANGGLDANWMVRHGIPTVTFGAGQNAVHTVKEWINLKEYRNACALAVQLATTSA